MSSPEPSRATTPYASSRSSSVLPPTTTGSPKSSTAASSPPATLFPELDEDGDDNDDDEADNEKWQKLEPFLERVTVYAKALKEQMDSAKYVSASAPGPSAPAKDTRNTRKRPRESATDTRSAKAMRRDDQSDVNSARDGADETADETKPRFTQPMLVTGATLKGYQLEGVAWMVGLYQNGISGILGAPSHAVCS